MKLLTLLRKSIIGVTLGFALMVVLERLGYPVLWEWHRWVVPTLGMLVINLAWEVAK